MCRFPFSSPQIMALHSFLSSTDVNKTWFRFTALCPNTSGHLYNLIFNPTLNKYIIAIKADGRECRQVKDYFMFIYILLKKCREPFSCLIILVSGFISLRQKVYWISILFNKLLLGCPGSNYSKKKIILLRIRVLELSRKLILRYDVPFLAAL